MIIKIKNLRVKTIIGVHAWEKKQKRDVVVNLEMEFDGNKAANTDDIADTLDYDHINQMLIEEISNSKFNLIEKLCRHLLDKIMADKRISRAKIEIDKPKALKNGESVSIVEEAVR
jgi:FolB domain-containing protein